MATIPDESLIQKLSPPANIDLHGGTLLDVKEVSFTLLYVFWAKCLLNSRGWLICLGGF